MKTLAIIFTAFVAISHVGILILEMFFWNHPIGQKIFVMTPEMAESFVGLIFGVMTRNN